MFKKAQAAMEFLMTYGWAILVVLAAIGALAYFGVLSPGNLLPQRCEFSAGLDCTEHPTASIAGIVAANGMEICFPVTNSLGYDINGVTALDSAGNCAATAPIVIANGQSGILCFDTCPAAAVGDRYSMNVDITYISSQTTQTHVTTGRVAGKWSA